jgi:hypothetical protein
MLIVVGENNFSIAENFYWDANNSRIIFIWCIIFRKRTFPYHATCGSTGMSQYNIMCHYTSQPTHTIQRTFVMCIISKSIVIFLHEPFLTRIPNVCVHVFVLVFVYPFGPEN